MTGLYIHIPFCKQACRYCDFYFTVSFNKKEEIIKSICEEITQRTANTEKILLSTIYFGGGTPSVLKLNELEILLDIIFSKFKIINEAEISLEANPDDLSYDYLKNLKNLGINRLSIGIQSFSNNDLILMRRSHSADQGIYAIENSIKSGFQNISVDLIYGLPGMYVSNFQQNLEILTSFDIKHISAYHLTYEAGTVFDHWRKKGRLIPIDEDESIAQFIMLRSFLKEKGYDHYEISNFAKSGFYSIHNSNYWKQIPYLGVGPAAHSYTGITRRWNYSSIKKYLEGIWNNMKYYEEEILSEDDLYNEYLMTSLRTKWGMNLKEIKNKFGNKRYNYLLNKIDNYIAKGFILQQFDNYYLTESGMLLSDNILSDLFI